MNTAGVILAAGFSRRLGRPKQQVLLGGESLLQRAVRTAQAAGLAPVLVVVREAPHDAEAVDPEARIVVNADAAEGMASSVRAAVCHLKRLPQACSGVVLMTCDQPLLRAEHLRALCRDPLQVVASAYGGRKGVPAYFPATAFDVLLALHGDQGARSLLQDAHALPNADLALDIDTDEDLRRAEQIFAARAG